MADPAHNGVFAPAVGVGAAGLTVTATVPAALLHPATVTNTEYVPVAAVLVEAIVGF